MFEFELLKQALAAYETGGENALISWHENLSKEQNLRYHHEISAFAILMKKGFSDAAKYIKEFLSDLPIETP